AYGAYVPIADNAPLSASWWHNVTMVFEKNDAAFQQYWTYRGKSANLQGDCAAGSTCQTELICNLRAGKSSDACTPSKINGHKKRHDEADDVEDPSGLHSLYKRADPQTWDKKLCGLSF
ncbi:hypothetical protein BGZ54_001239, partial [Gamsiella multidivaricata]